MGLALIPANYPLLKSKSHDWLFPQAIRSKHLPAIQLLLEKGVAVTKCITQHMGFESERDYDILRLLLDHGFDANWALQHRMYYLVRNDRYEILELLLEHGADPNARVDGYTALHYCADVSEGPCLCMPLLLEAKADVDAVTKDGYTAVALACKARSVDKTRWPPLHTAVHHGAEDLVKLLLDAGAQVNFEDDRGKTPLHVALEDTEDTEQYDEVDIPMMLLEAGADPTIRCNANKTPLHTFSSDMYCSNNTIRLLDRLVESGVELDADDGSGKTIFVHSIFTGEPRHGLGILLHLYPADVPKLLLASRRTRSLFWLTDDEHSEARKHVELHFPDIEDAWDLELFNLCSLIPFRKLPMAYALGFISWKGTVDPLLVAIFPDDLRHYFHGFDPVRHPALIERLCRTALDLDLIKLPDYEQFYAFEVNGPSGELIGLVERLINAADPDPRSTEWSERRVELYAAALCGACNVGSVAVAKHVLSISPVNLRNVPNEHQGRTAVHFAAWLGGIEVLEVLFAPVNGVAPEIDLGALSHTPLVDVTDKGNFDVTLWLLAHDVATNGITHGYLALLKATKKGDKEITEALLAKGSNRTYPIVIPLTEPHSNLLLSVKMKIWPGCYYHTAQKQTTLTSGAVQRFITRLRTGIWIYFISSWQIKRHLVNWMVKILHPLDSAANEPYAVESNRSVFMFAVFYRHMDVIEWFLVEGGWERNINQADSMGNTALRYPAGAAEIHWVTFLMGFDPGTIRRLSEMTPRPDVVTQLLQHGADPRVKWRTEENLELVPVGPSVGLNELCDDWTILTVLDEWGR
ncbi:hypothetical protein HDU96_003687 [Phlyctochytrium bullatum]|nr:hypothetical protein HDU96_003687 [Phlyctochytrium bullatum]